MFSFPVVFVDIETTGGSYYTSRVLEIAVIRYEGAIVDEFHTLINPQSYIPAQITQLTGIRERDVVDAPVFDDIAEQLLEIMDGAVFVAHNVRFDYSFLRMEFAKLGIDFSPKLLCTVRLSRALYPDLKGHSLAKLIERHAIAVGARHRALDDTRAILQFAQIAYAEHGQDAFALAVSRQLKTQYLPAHLDSTELEAIGNEPGVYVFEDELRRPLYVGKSVTLKKRILSHFQDKSNKETKISQGVHHVRVIPTGSELAALVLESKMVKELNPLFNRQLRRVSKYMMIAVRENIDGYSEVTIEPGTVTDATDLSRIYGLFENRTKAKKRLELLTATFGLCPKLMGLEKTKGACFWYSLGKCTGACVGVEPRESYNQRVETALERDKLESWPYGSAIAVALGEGSAVVIDNWMIQRFIGPDAVEGIIEPMFDVDEYKIIKRFLRENKEKIIVLNDERSMQGILGL